MYFCAGTRAMQQHPFLPEDKYSHREKQSTCSLAKDLCQTHFFVPPAVLGVPSRERDGMLSASPFSIPITIAHHALPVPAKYPLSSTRKCPGAQRSPLPPADFAKDSPSAPAHSLPPACAATWGRAMWCRMNRPRIKNAEKTDMSFVHQNYPGKHSKYS